MMGGDAANHQDLVKIAGPEAAAGYFFISPPLPQDMDMPEARNFLTAYKAKYNSVPVSVWAVLAGDAFKVIEAALAAGKTEPEQMAAWLKQLKDMPGLSGALGFDAKGDRVASSTAPMLLMGKGLSFCNPSNLRLKSVFCPPGCVKKPERGPGLYIKSTIPGPRPVFSLPGNKIHLFSTSFRGVSHAPPAA